MTKKSDPPEPLALPADELDRIAAAAREAWDRQGDGQLTDSRGRVWSFRVDRSPGFALRLDLGPYAQGVSQLLLGVADHDHVRTAAERLDTLAQSSRE